MPDGEMPEGGAPGGEAPDGERPEGGMPDGGEALDGERAEGGMPEGGTPDGEVPVGEMPEGGRPGGGSIFTASEETITFNLTEETAVTIEYLQGSGEGTLEEIVTGTVLEITLDENGNAVMITVKNLNAGNGFGSSGEVTNGTGSPAVYCTADIQVSDAVLTANASEGVVVEGKRGLFFCGRRKRDSYDR